MYNDLFLLHLITNQEAALFNHFIGLGAYMFVSLFSCVFPFSSHAKALYFIIEKVSRYLITIENQPVRALLC